MPGVAVEHDRQLLPGDGGLGVGAVGDASATAQAMAFSYQVAPPVVSTPSIRARTVKNMARVMGVSGEKVVPEVPLKRPWSTT